ncbi:MAG: hypothetical protein IJP46_05520 [Prevotella sp.]|nr:hypothetical protein [Prevotella sp.]
MKFQKPKRNTPIVTLIRNYMNKKSGKVSVSREEIKWRFDHLDWKDQKIILFAFMDSGISDREWAYSKMLDNWDDSFQPKVKELWETYHEYKCSWSIIRYFPLEYIKEHIGEFTDERDYYFICLRLAKDKDYAIDRTKLTDKDYLAVLWHTGRTVSDDEARDTLFSIIHDCCLADTFMPRLEHVGEGRHDKVITPANYREVNLAIYYLLKLEKDNIVQQFEQWNEQVEDAINDSSEFMSIDRNDYFLDYEYDRRRVEIANLYAFQFLDEKYKLPSDPTVEQMREAQEQNIEWSRMQRERPAQNLYEVTGPDFNEMEDDGEYTLPF